MEYETLIGTSGKGLDELVNRYLAQGWKISGSPYATGQFNAPTQAMVKGDYRSVAKARYDEDKKGKS